MKVNFSILVYFHFIDFITTYPFPSKMTKKVYIQNTINKESKNYMNKNKHLIDIQLIRSNSYYSKDYPK